MLLWSVCYSQTALTAGDIVFTGFNSDDPDMFSFVLLENVTSGTTIHFTDHGWFSAGGFRNSEGTITWTAPAGGVLAGTHITYTNPSSFSLGSASGSNPSLSATGDQLFAYQGLEASPTLLAGLHTTGPWDADAISSNTSALPPSITSGFNLALTPHQDNLHYNMSVTSGTKGNLLAALNNPANWIANNNPLPVPPGAGANFTVCDTSGNSGNWVWTGAVNNNWFECGNWDVGSLPGSIADVTIPGAPVNQPVISSGIAYCKSITIQADLGALLTIDTPSAGELEISD